MYKHSSLPLFRQGLYALSGSFLLLSALALLALNQVWLSGLSGLLIAALLLNQVAFALLIRWHDKIVQQMALLDKALDNCAEAIVITHADATIINVNPAYERITGFKREDVVGKNPRIVRSGLHDQAFYQNMWETLVNDGYWEGEITDRRQNGELFSKWLAISAMRDNKGETTHYVGVFQDISAQKETHDKLHQLVFYDRLTGLPNRVLLQEHIEQTLENARCHHSQIALMYLDLDNFKWVNDSLGHIRGDQLLRKVAERLRKNLGKADFIARLGGDELCVVTNTLTAGAEAADVANKIIVLFHEAFFIDGQEVHVSCSIGIAIFPDDGDNSSSLNKCADLALFQAKKEGRNTYRFFSPAQQAHATERVELENALHKALENKEFLIYYQPKVCLSDRSLVGMEALLRWKRPGIGLVSPERFIPLAEETGLIIPIGTWVLEEVCRQIKIWGSNCEDFAVAVNLSPRQFKETDFLQKVIEIVKNSGINPSCLELEVTEGMLMEDVEQAIERMKILRDMGITIAVDDFGTGYSSLAYLKRLPIDTLKIDRSFIRELTKTIDDDAIVDATVNLAHRLGLRVVAEGVEIPTQVDYLTAKGCDEVQGYFFGQPLPATDYTEPDLQDWLKKLKPYS
jgi:diguanylate cyclase (GGDEF)-like protein/PAS domain S-box-containing protein